MKRFLASLVLGALLIAPLAHAEETASSDLQSENLSMAVQQSSLLWQLKEKLAQAEYRLFLLENNVEVATEGLEELKAAITYVEVEIAELDAAISNKKDQMTNVKAQMELKRMEVEDLESQVLILTDQLRQQKELVGELMSLIYYKRGIFFDEEGVNAVKVLASPGSVSETLQNITYLRLLEDANTSEIDKMAALSDELQGKWESLRTKREELERLDQVLAEQLVELQAQRAEKLFLWEELKEEEAVFESMIISADEQEDDLRQQVSIYKQNVQLMEEKLDGTRGALSDGELEFFQAIEAEQLMSFSLEESLSGVSFASPLPYGITHSGNPDGLLEITAYFIDSGYRSLFGVDHYALDMRAKQGTAIQAVADGVIQEVVWDEDSARYAYVKVAHRNGLITVSGHIQNPEVSAGDIVRQGDILAYAGGTPGTPGAGARTTGPHLHLEVWHDGLRVDPLMYLPLDLFVQDDLPDEYQEQLRQQLEEKVKVAHSNASGFEEAVE